MDPQKIRTELSWEPEHPFEVWIEETIDWYLKNTDWVEHCAQKENPFANSNIRENSRFRSGRFFRRSRAVYHRILGKLKDKVRFTVLTSGDCKPYLKAFPDEVNRKQIPLPPLAAIFSFSIDEKRFGSQKIFEKNPNDILHSNSVRAALSRHFRETPLDTLCARFYPFPNISCSFFPVQIVFFVAQRQSKTTFFKKDSQKKNSSSFPTVSIRNIMPHSPKKSGVLPGPLSDLWAE
jgi:hypothetical protein